MPSFIHSLNPLPRTAFLFPTLTIHHHPRAVHRPAPRPLALPPQPQGCTSPAPCPCPATTTPGLYIAPHPGPLPCHHNPRAVHRPAPLPLALPLAPCCGAPGMPAPRAHKPTAITAANSQKPRSRLQGSGPRQCYIQSTINRSGFFFSIVCAQHASCLAPQKDTVTRNCPQKNTRPQPEAGL